jgi:hypothetical protein
MPFGEEDAAQLDPLTGRPQPGTAEPCGHAIAKGRVSEQSVLHRFCNPLFSA